MSTIPLISIEGITVRAESGRRLTSATLGVRRRQYSLILDQDQTLSQQFSPATEVSPDTSITLSYEYKTRIPLHRRKTQIILAKDLFANFMAGQTRELSIVQDGIQVVFTCQTSGTLLPTTQVLSDICPRFRILVIGKTGVGKSSLISRAFGIDKACSADLMRGSADIQEGLISPVNRRFILHDSLGFEPGDQGNYATVKDFIRSRRSGDLKDRLHAVWFCIPVPRAGGRLLEAAAEDLFREKKATLGAIPLIVVYTMLDTCVDDETIRLMKSGDVDTDEQSLEKRSRLQVASIVEKRHQDITRLAGESLPYAIVSTKGTYEDTLQNLVQLTHHQVGIPDTRDAQITSAVTLMAQRIAPDLKIRGSINVGKQRYWRALRTSPDFAGHTIWDCISVVHADVVAVWNFNDPCDYLSNDKFKELVVKMVQDMQLNPSLRFNRILASSGGALFAAISSHLGAIAASPAAPIALPIVAGVAVAVWLYDVYQNVKNVQRVFMAFIVDLVHILETLFILTGRDHKKLTRRAIKLAYSTYHKSEVQCYVHAEILRYHDVDGRDAALEMIESLLEPGPDTPSIQEYYAKLNLLSIEVLELDREEEW